LTTHDRAHAQDGSSFVDVLRPRSPEALFSALVLLLLVVLAGFMPAQSDTWWNLAAGRHIVHTGSVHLAEPFSWTSKGNYWSNHEWLSQVLMYGAYRSGGMPGVAALATIVVAAAMAMLWKLMAGPPLLRAVLLLVLAPWLVSGWVLRPQVFTLLALAVTVTLLSSRRYAWLPVVFLVWSNLHGAVALGVVVLGAACLEALLHDRARLRPLVVASAVSVAATALTPLGFSLLEDVVLSIRRPDFAYLSEWQPAGREPWTYGFFGIAAGTAVLLWHRGRELSFRERLFAYLSAMYFLLALRYARNVPIFTFLAAPLVSSLLARLAWCRSSFRSSRPRSRPITAPLGAALVMGVTAIVFGWTMRPAVLGWDPLAPEAREAIRSCGQPLYNHFDNGGHLIWFVPEQPVFVDSRQHPYPAAFLVEHFIVEDTGAYEATFAKYGIVCAVLPPSSPVGRALVRDGWHVSYRDDDWLVVVRTRKAPAVTTRGQQS
jgi:hypothetical protein